MVQQAQRIPKILAALGLFIISLVFTACSSQTQVSPDSSTSPTPPAALQPISSTAQSADRIIRFDRISITEGLSEAVVNDTLQDRQGFLWFATQDGLNRYDGYSFKIYLHDSSDPTSLSLNHVTKLLEDRRGQIWAGTLHGGLNRLDPATGKFTRYPQLKKSLEALTDNELPLGRISGLVEDPQGYIWIGIDNGGLHRYDPAQDTFQHYFNQPDHPNSLIHNAILNLTLSNTGSLWISTYHGLDRFDPETGVFTHYRYQKGQVDGLAGEEVCCTAEDSQGQVWIGTHHYGLDRLDPVTGKFVHYPFDTPQPISPSSPSISALLIDHSGVVWVGTGNYGLCRLKSNQSKFECFHSDPQNNQSLAVDIIQDLYEDRSGIIWVGTFGGGANKLDPGYKPFIHLKNDPENPNSLGGNVIFAVYQDLQKNLWVGTDNAGLDRIDGATGEVTHYRNTESQPDQLTSNWIRAIWQDRGGALWVGTTTGLNRLAPGETKFKRIYSKADNAGGLKGGGITAIAEDSEGKLWLASDATGLYHLDPTTEQFTHFQRDPLNSNSLADNCAIALFIDSQGILWIGTNTAGLERFDPQTGQFTHYPSQPDDPRSISSPTVLSIQEDHQGNIWVGTTSGLNKLTRSNDPLSSTFQHYTVKEGLPNDVIYRIEVDQQGRLWLSTNKGLARFDPQSGQIKNYDVRDGLQSNEFDMGASFKGADGTLMFGGIQGLTLFNPQRIQDNLYIPPVVLTGLSRRGEPLEPNATDPAGEITIRWPENSLEFEFAALNYVRPENNQYAYRLDGFDRAWNSIGNRRTGRYTNLPGGNYTLYLKGSNNDGVWNEAPTAVHLRVIPPLWATWWFRGLASILVVGSVLGGVRLRMHSVESRNQELERLVRARTAELERLSLQARELAVVEERNRLARDLHDSAKQKAFAALAQLGAANELVQANPNKTHLMLREAETLVYEVIEELTFLIQEMYPVALKEKGLASVLREYVFEWEGRNEIRIDLKIEHERRLALKIEQSLYRIIQEALANVARHSQASRVDVTVRYTPEQIQITIADNGCGFDLAGRPAGVGLRSMQERIAMIGGQLTIQTAPGQGTRITASAPVVMGPDNEKK